MEVTPSGNVIKEVPSQYDVFPDGRKELVFISEGTTGAYEIRKYKLYFDSAENGPKPQPMYNTGLRFDASGMVVKNQDMKVELNKANGLIQSVYLKVVSDEIPSFTADDTWLDIGYNGGTVWYGAYQEKGDFEIVTSGPVRIIMRSVSDTGEYPFGHVKEYEIFSKESCIYFALDISAEDISLNSAAESIRLHFDSNMQWSYSFFDGGEVMTGSIPDSPHSIEAEEDWLSVHNDEFGLQYVMVENYASNAYFLGSGFVAASRGLALPGKNVYIE